MNSPTRSVLDDATHSHSAAVPDETRPQSGEEAEHSAGRSVGKITIPDYELLDTLGEGGMAVVWKAMQLKLNRIVALKLMHSGGGASARLRFLTEAEAVAAIDHPHVVRVFDTGTAGNTPYLAMEYLCGGTLAERLKQGPLSLRVAAELVRQLALAVQAAHTAQVVHRDLKPANVLFDAGGEPRITDFGLAKRSSGDLTATNVIMGTAAYMAPEQARGESKFVGPAADVWALGVILYECLSGARPFSGSHELEVIQKVVNDEPSSLRSVSRSVPRELELVAQKCLTKDPSNRYATAAALADDLGRWLAGQTVSVQAAGPMERTVKWVRRNRVGAAIGMILLITATSTSVAAWYALDRSREADAKSIVARAESEKAQTAGEEAKSQAREANIARGEVTQRLTELQTQKDLTDREWKRADAAEKTAQTRLNETLAAKAAKDAQVRHTEVMLYLSSMREAFRAQLANDTNTFQRLLGEAPYDLRGWEHDYLITLQQKPKAPVAQPAFDDALKSTAAFAFHPDGRRLITLQYVIPPNRAYRDRTYSVNVWDADRNLVTSHPFPIHRGNDMKSVPVLLVHPTQPIVIVSGKDSYTLDGFNWESGLPFEIRPETSPLELTPRFSPDGTLVGNNLRWKIEEANGSIKSTKVSWSWKLGKAVYDLSNQKRHKVRIMAVRPDGRELALGMSDGSIILCDVANESAAVYSAHTRKAITSNDQQVAALAYDSSGRLLASGGIDGRIVIRDNLTGKVLYQLRHHAKPVRALAFSPDSHRLATGGDDSTISLWDLETGHQVVDLLRGQQAVQNLAFSADGRTLFAHCQSVPHQPGQVVLFSTSSQSRTQWLKDGQTISPTGGRSEPVLNRDGTRVLGRSVTNEVQVWELPSGRALFGFNVNYKPRPGSGMPHDVLRAKFTNHDNFIQIYDDLENTTTAYHVLTGRPGQVFKYFQTIQFPKYVQEPKPRLGKAVGGYVQGLIVTYAGPRPVFILPGTSEWERLHPRSTARETAPLPRAQP